jgi:ABC-2 type transport system permease protein
MISSIIRTGLISLRRDRGALALSFLLPIVFFSTFAVIFGGRRDTTPRIAIIVVDEDQSTASRRLVKGLQREGSLSIQTRETRKGNVQPPEYTAATAEAAVKRGVAPLALVIPHGFGANPLAFGPTASRPTVQLLEDPSDPVAAQITYGLLQKVAMTSMPDVMFEQGVKYMDQFTGGFTRQQRRRVQEELDQLRQWENQSETPEGGTGILAAASGAPVAVNTRDVIGENKKGALVSFYAAAIGVMFLLFTASGASGSLLEEMESGTLDRILSTRVTMTTLLAGKLAFCTLLAFSQLVLMFLWAWLVFKLDFINHIPGFVVMGMSTAFAVGTFGMLLASLCRTRAQLGALSTLVILIMSSVGGSMFPRFLMPEGMQKAGLLTINAWAIDGFTKVFWRDEPISHLWPQVVVLLAAGVLMFTLARRLARRWEYV